MANQEKKTNNSKSNNKVNNKKNNKTVEKKTVKGTTKKESTKAVKEEKVIREVVKEENVMEEKEVNTSKHSFKLTSMQRDIILILLVAVVLVIALVLTKKPKLDIELPVALAGDAGYNEITYADYEAKMEAKEPFLVIIVKDGCPFCEDYEPIVKEVAEEYKLPINFINLTHLSDEEFDKLATSNLYLKRTQWGTPTTLFLYGNTVVDSIGGYVEKDELMEFVRANFVIEENEQ